MNSSSTFRPNWTSAPGSTISDLLSENQMSIGGFAQKIDKTPEYVGKLLHGEVTITDDIAHKLKAVFGGSAEFWTRREAQFRDDEKRLWLNDLPLKEMIEFGWLTESKNKIETCLDFFNVKSIKDWQKKYSEENELVTFRTSPSFKSQFGAVSAWLRQGEIQGEQIDCKEWNPSLFSERLMQLKQLSRKKYPKDFIPILKEACAECGVALAVVRAPSGCKASGATKFINPKKALLIVSFRHLTDDHFWFTFFHEAGHLLLHGNKHYIIEGMFEENTPLKEETEANNFAADMLIPKTLSAKLTKLRLSNNREVLNFAAEAEISPGIVIGQLQKMGQINFRSYNAYKRRYKWENIVSDDSIILKKKN